MVQPGDRLKVFTRGTNGEGQWKGRSGEWQQHRVERVEWKLFFLTHDDERAPAAAASGERRKSAGALRWIDPWTRSTDLDVLVCIATDRTSLLCHNCSGVQPLLKSPSMSQVQEGYRPGTVCDTRMLCATQQSCHHPAAVRRTFASLFGATSARMEDLDGRAARW